LTGSPASFNMNLISSKCAVYLNMLIFANNCKYSCYRSVTKL